MYLKYYFREYILLQSYHMIDTCSKDNDNIELDDNIQHQQQQHKHVLSSSYI
jgi:hypothetical protein